MLRKVGRGRETKMKQSLSYIVDSLFLINGTCLAFFSLFSFQSHFLSFSTSFRGKRAELWMGSNAIFFSIFFCLWNNNKLLYLPTCTCLHKVLVYIWIPSLSLWSPCWKITRNGIRYFSLYLKVPGVNSAQSASTDWISQYTTVLRNHSLICTEGCIAQCRGRVVFCLPLIKLVARSMNEVQRIR